MGHFLGYGLDGWVGELRFITGPFIFLIPVEIPREKYREDIAERSHQNWRAGHWRTQSVSFLLLLKSRRTHGCSSTLAESGSTNSPPRLVRELRRRCCRKPWNYVFYLQFTSLLGLITVLAGGGCGRLKHTKKFYPWRGHTTRNTWDRRITHRLQIWVSKKCSISQLGYSLSILKTNTKSQEICMQRVAMMCDVVYVELVVFGEVH